MNKTVTNHDVGYYHTQQLMTLTIVTTINTVMVMMTKMIMLRSMIVTLIENTHQPDSHYINKMLVDTSELCGHFRC